MEWEKVEKKFGRNRYFKDGELVMLDCNRCSQAYSVEKGFYKKSSGYKGLDNYCKACFYTKSKTGKSKRAVRLLSRLESLLEEQKAIELKLSRLGRKQTVIKLKNTTMESGK